MSDKWPEWTKRVTEVVDQAHEENWGGKHREGFCEACADAQLVAQYAVPNGPSACEHKWIDIRNSVVTSGEMCKKCGVLIAGNEHTN